MVVGKAAAVEGEAASWRFRSGVNSHRLATAIFVAPPFFAARASIIDTPGPRRSNGKGSSAMASTAFASTVTPVSAGGIQLWPPGAVAVPLGERKSVGEGQSGAGGLRYGGPG